MANKAGTVTVELRMLLDKLRQDVRDASAEMRSGLQQEMRGAGAATTKTAGEVEKLDKSLKKAASSTKALKDAAVEAWRAQFRAQNPGGPQVRDLTQQQGGRPGGGAPGQVMLAHATTLKNIGFPLLRRQQFWHGQAPPVIPPPVQGGAQAGGNSLASMWSKAINYQMSPMLAGLTKVTAGFGALRVVVGQFKWALDLAIAPLRALAHQFAQAAEQARRLYAKQLQSGGLPGGFVAKRSLIAEAIGVGDEEVMQYGKAVAYLNDKFSFSSSILAGTTRELTAASWEMKALQSDLRAMWSAIAAELSPAVRMLVADLRDLVQLFTPLLSATAAWISLQLKALRALNAISHAMQGNFVQALAELKKMMDASKTAPEAQASSARLPASAWERMGLVLGNGGQNYAQETARNTGRMVRLMEIIAQGYVPRGDDFSGGGLRTVRASNP